MKRNLLIIILCVLILQFSIPSITLVEADAPLCGSNPLTAAILGEADNVEYEQLLKSLSGERAVTIGGQPFQYIETRYAPAIANGSAKARVMPWMLEQLNGWLQPAQIELDDFTFYYNSFPYTGQNIIATFPGTLHPEEIVILSAHFDSISSGNSFDSAPGAEDNASGTAALLEAARLLRSYRFDRTIKLVWFNAEELGLLGSASYVTDHDVSNVVGVVNLDMFGYDSNSDGCFELHVGTLPQSDLVGQCFVQTIQSNSLPLTFDYLTEQVTDASDHGSFWEVNVGAVEVLENHWDNQQPGGCVGVDESPFYHQTTDLSTNMNLPIAFQIAQAGIATAANLAGPVGVCYEELPQMAFTGLFGANLLQWQAPPQAGNYLLERSTTGCSGEFTPLGSTTDPQWLDEGIQPGVTYAYRMQVVGDASRGYCLSAPVCAEYTSPDQIIFLPALFR